MAMVVRGDRDVVVYQKPKKVKNKKNGLSTEQRIERAMVAAGNAFQLSKTIYGYLQKLRPIKRGGGVSEGMPPSAYNATVASIAPTISSLRGGGKLEGQVNVTHREYVGSYGLTIGGFESTFRIVTPVNPTNYTLFPWLASIAASYEEYKFTRLNFCIVPTCPTSTSGKVMMALDPDSGDSDPSSVGELMNMRYASSAAPWEPQVMPYKPCGQWRFAEDSTRNMLNPINRLVDDGKFYLSGSGSVLAQAFDVFVEYSVLLRQPQAAHTAVQSYTLASGAPTNAWTNGALVRGPGYTSSEGNLFHFKQTGHFLMTIVLNGVAIVPNAPIVGADLSVKEASSSGLVAFWVIGVYVNALETADLLLPITATTFSGDSVHIAKIDSRQFAELY